MTFISTGSFKLSRSSGVCYRMVQRGGLFSSSPRRITLHLSLVNPASDAWGLGKVLGAKFAADVLLHEMMHQHIYERDGTSTEGHNTQQWADEINRIAPLLGLTANAQPVKQKRIKAEGAKGKGKVVWVAAESKMPRLEMATWPHSQLSAEYYETSAVGCDHAAYQNA